MPATLLTPGQPNDNSGTGIKARIFHADATPVTGDLTVNSNTFGNQTSPSIAADLNGNFVIAWTDPSGALDTSGTGIVAQAFSGTGAHITASDFLVNQIVAGNQDHVNLSSRPDGSILATFEDASRQAQGSQTPDTGSGVTPATSPNFGIQAEVLALDTPTNPPPPSTHVITRVERFFDSATGDHFYTTSVAEANQIRATLPTYHDEGAPWGTPDKGSDTTDVFRFFDVATGNHFFTDSTAERDQVLATLPSYHFEGVAFEAFTAPEAGTITLERFFNTQSHLHTFGASAAENASIRSGGAGPGWVDEGAGFIVHA